MNDTYLDDDFAYAGFGLRLAAVIIDTVILSFATWILFFILGTIGFGVFAASAESFDPASGGVPDETAILAMMGGLGFVYLFVIVSRWLYYALQESSPAQATLGKRAVGIIVTDEEGERISFGRATGRYFGKMISGIILAVGYIMAAFTEKKQALHDMIAHTLVVKREV